MLNVADFVAAVQSGIVPDRLIDRLPEVAALYDDFTREASCRAQDGRFVYGTNTLPGHLALEADGGRIDLDPAMAILSSHVLGSPPFFPHEATRCISLAKLCSVASLGPPLSGETYGRLAETVLDHGFAPDIPMGASYSCGDVIPATHWLVAWLDWTGLSPRHGLKPGEVMTLINGNFIHVGASVHLLMRLRQFWPCLLQGLISSASALEMDRLNLSGIDTSPDPWLSRCLGLIRDGIRGQVAAYRAQLPVSARAVPQILETLGRQIILLAGEIERLLSLPSGNPLLVKTDDDLKGIGESASFISPALAIACEALTEALLFCAWGSAQRIQHMVAPQRLDVAWGSASQKVQIELVQVPKLAMAHLESLREHIPKRLFSSGSSTSFGEEDLWTSGVNRVVDALECIPIVEGLLAMEWAVGSVCLKDMTVEELSGIIRPGFFETVTIRAGAARSPRLSEFFPLQI